ncbi:MAG: hypothetical protein KUG73_09530 [Pseudomonadales bacterium]|nr:hypothetical protein [Pseudomonadales bacterium]
MFKRKEYIVASFVLLVCLTITFSLISFDESKSLSSTQESRSKALGSLINKSDNVFSFKSIATQGGRQESNKAISLQGTDIPDGLITDSQGDLNVSFHLKQLFDYFYTLLGRKTEEEINSIIVHKIETKLTDPAKNQALTILRNYQLLQEQLYTLPTVTIGDINNLHSLEHYLEKRNSLRDQYLGSEVSGIFYDKEEAYDRYSLERLKLANNIEISEEERARLSEDLLNSLPPALRQPIQKRQQLLRIREQEQNPDSSIETLFQQRESIVGYELSEKLQALDVRREQWKARYKYYQKQVQHVSDSGLSSVDKVQAIAQIRQRLFKESEIKRVNSLDRIGG